MSGGENTIRFQALESDQEVPANQQSMKMLSFFPANENMEG